MTLITLGPDWPDLPQVRAFVFSRAGGASAPPYASLNPAQHVGDDAAVVAANRQRITTWLPGSPRLQWLNQVHGTRVVDVSARHAVSAGPLEADGLVTGAPGVACCVMTADCLPVFLSSDQGDEVALVHAGWRGLAAGIIDQAVATMRSPANQLRAWLGPAIAACHFEVGGDVRATFRAGAFANGVEEDALTACFQPGEDSDKYMADLYALARLKLQALGIAAIAGGDHCSYCDSQRFYSFRRDGRTGRNLSVIYLQPDSGI